MLQFRNTEGQVTDRFGTKQEGTVRLAAGDFEFVVNESYFSYKEENTVSFSYSPYNTENWMELSLTKYPEYFQMPAFGDYYEASLADITLTPNTMWYDVKIVCTDAAGNSQTQVLSPAFKINNSTAIQNPITATHRNVQIDHNLLSVDTDVAETITVYSITGSQVLSVKKAAGKKSINISHLPKGVYLVRSDSAWCEKVFK
jgi:hypothetical protein